MENVILREVVDGDADGAEILIEVEAARGGVPRRYEDYGPVRGDGGVSERAFQKGMELIRTCAHQIANTIDGVVEAARPTDVEVQLGIKLSGETGAFIAKAGAEGHLQVTLKWTRKREQ